jgi:type VI secretion system protein ImpM
VNTLPGWFGKLPTLGDFAQRRLDPAWVQRWDGWLAQGLAELREDEGWLERYLAAPAWRFALLPGVIGAGLSVGVLVPSVDRVGRYFPLTVAASALDLPQTLTDAQALWHWAGQLEDAAVAALQQDWTVEVLDQTLAALRTPKAPAPTDPFDATLSRMAVASVAQVWEGHSLWWRGGEAEPALRVAGLPAGRQFKALFL